MLCNLLALVLLLFTVTGAGMAQTQTAPTEDDTTLANRYFADAEKFSRDARFDSSIFYYEKAGRLYEKTAIRLRQPRLWEKYVKSYNNLGDNYRRRNDGAKALAYLNQALETGRKRLGENHLEVAQSFHNLGNVYFGQVNFKKALEISRQTYGENSSNVAGLCDNIGFVLQRQGDYEQAMTYFNRALSILKKIYDHDNSDFARNYYNTGELYLRKNDLAPALDYYGKALAIRREVLGEHDPVVARTYWRMADVYSQQNNFTKAIASAHLAILSVTPAFTDTNVYANPPLQNISLEVELLAALHMKALNFERLFSLQSYAPQDLQVSLSTYQLALDLIDKTRRSYRTEGSKLYLGNRASEVYENAIRVALVAHHAAKDPKFKEKAFSFVEKSKAAALAQVLQESQARQFAGLPPDLLEKERNLKIDLAFYETESEKERQRAEKADKAKLRQDEDRYFALARAYEKLLVRLEKNYPQYYALKYKTATASVAELQKSLDDKTALLEYFLGDNSIFAFAISKDGFETVSMDIDSSFKALVVSLSNSFKNVTAKTAYLQSAVQLYRTLVQPLISLLANKSR